ncbi:MAG: DMT family transporter, partial [Anaerolineales bacterium]
TLWILVSIVVVRTILQTFALRFTKAYLVQLINLLAPFLVVLLNRVFSKESLPKYIFIAITISLLGGGLMILGGKVNDPSRIVFSSTDWIGVVLAFLGTFGIAAYMVIVKRSHRIGLPFEVVYIAQIGTMSVLMAILSLVTEENWAPFLLMDWRAVLAFLSVAIGVEIGCKIGNIAVLRKLGAPLVSSMLALRLVAALFLGWIILGEQLESELQWVGAIIVVITITWFLSSQIRVREYLEPELSS